MFILIMVYLNLITCIWIFLLKVPDDLKEKIDSGKLGDVSKIDFDSFMEDAYMRLPEKLKCSYNEYYENDSFKYLEMMFMNLFNILANDISPTKLIAFIVSMILMFLGVLIVGNLIGEFSQILNEIYDADLNNEAEEHTLCIDEVLQGLEIPENI